MPEKLKDRFFTEAFITKLGDTVQNTYPPFDQAAFNRLVYADNKEANFEPGIHTISKKHSFQNRTTRKHPPGPHQISIIVNGIEKATGSIALIEPR